ncbi:MAG: hypothetical protein PHS93_07750 [Candidatus Omnitrophica bacterium]|nr:hypothetical protein [Candidatus Omnitrophota bacterium]
MGLASVLVTGLLGIIVAVIKFVPSKVGIQGCPAHSGIEAQLKNGAREFDVITKRLDRIDTETGEMRILITQIHERVVNKPWTGIERRRT